MGRGSSWLFWKTLPSLQGYVPRGFRMGLQPSWGDPVAHLGSTGVPLGPLQRLLKSFKVPLGSGDSLGPT